MLLCLEDKEEQEAGGKQILEAREMDYGKEENICFIVSVHILYNLSNVL